jgi:hypothetical protein
MPSGGLFRKPLGVERDILHTFDFAVETCGGTQVPLLFGGGNAVTGVIDNQTPVRCVFGNAGVIGEEFAALCGHTARVSVEIGVADESVDKVLIFHCVMFLMLILFLFVLFFSLEQC